MYATQANREVFVKTALADDVLLFLSMQGEEEVGRLFEYRIQLLSSDGDVKIADVLGKPMCIGLERVGDHVRYFHGIVTSFASVGVHGDMAAYEATVHPWPWLLTRMSNCRIFQDKSVVEIVKEVCDDAVYGGVVELSAGALALDYPALPYCVQYRETDFAFVCRLLEGAGIYFYFAHEEDKHTMVLADSGGAHAAIPGYGALKFAGSTQQGVLMDEETVMRWSAGGTIVPSAHVLDDYDFEKAASCTSGALTTSARLAAAFGQPVYERYDYPGNYTEAADGGLRARARIESLYGQGERIDGTTNARGLHAGGLFTLAEHPRADQNRKYLVVATRYHLQTSGYASGGGWAPLEVACDVTAVGADHAWRPLPLGRKPCVRGPQTAIVVGPAGEEIHTDKYGRIKVQFHWDRVGQYDEHSSCWVRVAQGWAGQGWGAMAIPRIGMEVVVSFLEGDPDRPLVTGCVYNADAMPPYALPADQTRSTLKSRSSKGGGGANELRLEDKKGAEEIFVHAERDFNRIVKNNDSLKVGFETAAAGDQTIAIKHDQQVDIGNAQKVKAGTTILVEAGTSIELRVGGSSVKIEPARITIASPNVEIAANANVKVEAGATMDVKAGAVLAIAGAMVKIN